MHEDPISIDRDDSPARRESLDPIKRSRFFNPLLHAGFMFSALALVEWLWWKMGGPTWVERLDLGILVLAALYLLMTLVAVASLIPRGTRSDARAVLLLCLSAIFGAFGGLQIRGPIGDHGKLRICQGGQPIVDAIKDYEQQVGSSPIDLGSLIPNYLKELPGTGLVDFPNYQYSANSGTVGKWSLIVRIHKRGTERGHLVYKPIERYIQDRSDSQCKDIGTWGYKWPAL